MWSSDLDVWYEQKGESFKEQILKDNEDKQSEDKQS